MHEFCPKRLRVGFPDGPTVGTPAFSTSLHSGSFEGVRVFFEGLRGGVVQGREERECQVLDV